MAHKTDKNSRAKTSIESHESKSVGDGVKGDQITIGDISGAGIAIGRGAQASVIQESAEISEVAKLFATIYQQVEARPEDPDVDQEELIETIRRIEEETAKGDAASPNKISRWLDNLASMAPDILDVTVACLTSPVTGIATVIRKVANKTKEKTKQS